MLPSRSNLVPFDIPDGLRKISALPVFGLYFHTWPPIECLPPGSLQNLVNVMSLKYTMLSGPTEGPSAKQSPSNNFSTLAPAGVTLPVGAGNPASVWAEASPTRPMQVPMTAALRLNRRKVSIISSSCYASVEALAFTTDRRTNRLLKNSVAEPILTTKIPFNTFFSIPARRVPLRGAQIHQEKLTNYQVPICIPWSPGA